MALLEDRFRLWATVACYGGAYLLSLAVGWAVRALLGPTWAVAAGALVLFGASLFLSRNGLLDKLYLAILALSNTLYLEAFLPLLLGTLPFSTAGAFAAVASLVATLLLTALMGLCLYRPFRHFSGRGPSAFLAGMCLLQLAACGVSNGRVDFLFRAHIPAERLLAATLLYLAVLFAFRSVYQAGRYSQRVAEEAARSTMLEMESGDFHDTLAAVKEVRAARKAGEYALDTVRVMLQDGSDTLIPRYIASFKENGARLPILATYSENPYLSAVIAVKAAFAAQNSIHFESNALVGRDAPLHSGAVRDCQRAADPRLRGRRCLPRGAAGALYSFSRGKCPDNGGGLFRRPAGAGKILLARKELFPADGVAF